MKRVVKVLLAVVGLAVIGGLGFLFGLRWHDSRQTKGWNDAALLATTRRVHLEGRPGHQNPVFTFEIENHIGRDYAIREPSDIQYCVRHRGALSCEVGLATLLQIDLPVILPPDDKGLLFLHFRDASEPNQPAEGDTAAVERFLAGKEHLWNSFDSVVLLDERHRYRITLPMAHLPKSP